MAALRTENAKLRSIISERDERNYELCLRFLRMKHCKNDLKTRFQDLENEYLQVSDGEKGINKHSKGDLLLKSYYLTRLILLYE